MAKDKDGTQDVGRTIHLRTIPDLIEAHEWLFNMQRTQKIDAKSADSMNTTLKGSTYLNAKLKLEVGKLMLAAQVKKLELPEKLLPIFTGDAIQT